MRDVSSGTELIRHRLRAMAREEEQVRVLLPAMHRVIHTLFARLVELGWEPGEALAAVLMELGDAQDALAQQAIPD